MHHLLRPRIWTSFSPSCRLYEPEAWRPRVFLRQAQDKLTLRRTVQVRLRSNTLRLPGGTPIFTVSPQQFMKHSG
jgi:hypothetical protein